MGDGDGMGDVVTFWPYCRYSNNYFFVYNQVCLKISDNIISKKYRNIFLSVSDIYFARQIKNVLVERFLQIEPRNVS